MTLPKDVRRRMALVGACVVMYVVALTVLGAVFVVARIAGW